MYLLWNLSEKEMKGLDKMYNILFIFTDALGVGGIEISLISLLKNIDYKQYNVDLFLYAHRGELLNEIPKEVNLLPEVKELAYLRNSFMDKCKNGCYKAAYWRIWSKLFRKKADDGYRHLYKNLKFAFKKEYDLAISFFRPFDLIKDIVTAKTKVGWIHTDYTVEQDSDLRNDYENLDKIVAVSESVKQSFLQILPDFSDRVIVIENIYDIDYIKKKSTEFEVNEDMPKGNWTTVLSVGRFSKQKNFERIPQIVSELKKRHIDLKWYLIGWGAEEDTIKNEIKKNHVEDSVIVLGKKSNPYPYMKACDVYAQLSLYEGKSVCVKEAQILGKPVIITDYPTSQSQLINGYDGIIISRNTNECIEELYNLFTNKEKLNIIKENTNNTSYENSYEVNKVYSLIR